MRHDTLNEDFGVTIERIFCMNDNHICHNCGGNMYPYIRQNKYRYKDHPVVIDDVEVFKCEKCGESILTSQEAKRIEKIVLAEVEKKKS